MSELFPVEFERLIVAALRRVRSLRARPDSDATAVRASSAPRGTFAGHRRYGPGDDVRHVDWAAYARSGGLFAKVFEQDEHRALTILLDTTPSMSADGRFDAARRLAALVGALALDRADGVRLVCGGGDVHTFEGGAGVRKLVRTLRARGVSMADPVEFARVPIDRGWLGSLCWISDFNVPDRFAAALQLLRSTGRSCAGVLPAVAADRVPALDGWIELRDDESGSRERVRVDPPLRAALLVELARLEQHQKSVFRAAGQTLVRFDVPAQGDYRLSSWFSNRWISRI